MFKIFVEFLNRVNAMSKKILIVQRVITSYRLDLLKELCNYFDEVGIVTSQGEKSGTLKKANTDKAISEYDNLQIHELNAFKIKYTGETRGTSLFFYPKVISLINKYDVLLLEGTTNIINNSYIIPIARILGKKVIWWDSGYSEETRTVKRKIIDFCIKPFIKITHVQMAYSSKGKRYIENHMGGENVFLNLNTINTEYFETIKNEVENSIKNHKFDSEHIKLLYVGVVEKRKKIEELIHIVQKLNTENPNKKYSLTIIGGGNQLDELKLKYLSSSIIFQGPIYDKEALKAFYFNSDLFVLPGDGGLAILQSLLYGLPVLCIKGADGTERDYILDSSFLLDSLKDVSPFLKSLKPINRAVYTNYVNKVSSRKWVQDLHEKTP